MVGQESLSAQSLNDRPTALAPATAAVATAADSAARAMPMDCSAASAAHAEATAACRIGSLGSRITMAIS